MVSCWFQNFYFGVHESDKFFCRCVVFREFFFSFLKNNFVLHVCEGLNSETVACFGPKF